MQQNFRYVTKSSCNWGFTGDFGGVLLSGCPVQVERRGLEAHLSECNFRSRECPNGCGHTLHSIDQSQHNCVAELRLEVDMMRFVSSPQTFSTFCHITTTLQCPLWSCHFGGFFVCFWQGGDAVQGGGGETRDGVSAGLPEETHGAERVADEEWSGGAQGEILKYTRVKDSSYWLT